MSEIDKLPEIQTASSKHGKRALRKAAPFWNPELQQLWQNRCDKEKCYLSFQCDGRDRNQRNVKQLLLNVIFLAIYLQSEFRIVVRSLVRVVV